MVLWQTHPLLMKLVKEVANPWVVVVVSGTLVVRLPLAPMASGTLPLIVNLRLSKDKPMNLRLPVGTPLVKLRLFVSKMGVQHRPLNGCTK